jgi:hypothetical protein
MTLGTVVLALCAAPAAAQDYIAFHSPSGNIQCAIFAGDYAGARCDMSKFTQTFTYVPDYCAFDRGFSFGVDPHSAKGYLLTCVSDAMADPSGIELGYGQSISLAEITCQSEKTGMRCTNAGGHGFEISKARQSLF